jgi:hypothetical protein
LGRDLLYLAGLSGWLSYHPSYFPFSRWIENCPQLQLYLRGIDMPSRTIDIVGCSFVYNESCPMDIGVPPSVLQLLGTLQIKSLA